MRLDYHGSVDPKTGKEHIGFRVLGAPTPGDEVILKPGCNTIPAAQWLKVADTKAVKHLLATGQLDVLEDDSDGKKAKAFDLSKLRPDQALSLAKRTIEPDVLNTWLRQVSYADPAEVWQGVRTALENQIAEVTTDARGNPAVMRELKLQAA